MIAMRDATLRSASRASVAKAGLYASLLAASVGGLAACRAAGERASNVTRHGVASLQRGMSETAMVQVLGPPLSAAGQSDGSGPYEVLTYATPPTWHFGGRYLWTARGVRFTVTLRGEVLDSAYVAGTGVGSASRLCACTAKACAKDWANSCLDLFPE